MLRSSTAFRVVLGWMWAVVWGVRKRLTGCAEFADGGLRGAYSSTVKETVRTAEKQRKNHRMYSLVLKSAVYEAG